jgi:two-component system sensor histidine kinase KdpD
VADAVGGGAGLGLTICRGIVRAHGGRMWVESREGGGASFRFTFPLGEPAREREVALEPAGEGSR